MCLDLLKTFEDALSSFNRSLNEFETVPDELLGNGGLGRLAACFLDSGANLSLPLDGYGIKYKFGLFKQKIENGFQLEDIEDIDYNDPWCVPCFDDRAVVHFKEYDVYATPYDMPIVAYGSEHFSTLRLCRRGESPAGSAAEGPAGFRREMRGNAQRQRRIREGSDPGTGPGGPRSAGRGRRSGVLHGLPLRQDQNH